MKFLDFIGSIFSFVPNCILAILLLVIAFVAASIVKSLVTKLLTAVHAEKYLAKLGIKDTATSSAIGFVAKLAYFVTFLLFLPGVLDKLGMQSVSSPITSLVNAFLAFIPNLVGAGIIVAIGMFLANIVRDLLISLLKALKVDALQEKAGIMASDSSMFSNVIANVIYGLIVLITITAALNQLNVSAISIPANAIVSRIFSIIPNVLAAILIIMVGVFIARLVAQLLTSLLAGVGCDNLIEKVTGNAAKFQLSKLIGEIVKYVIVIIFLVQGINALGLSVLTGIGAAIIGYMPAVLSAVIIFALGVFAANTVKNLILKKSPDAKGSALLAQVAIYVLVAFLCLSQLNIASVIVEKTFILIVAALCVAFAIAFGVGGRKFAADTLDKLEKKMDDNK